jgi:hypothetical protein
MGMRVEDAQRIVELGLRAESVTFTADEFEEFVRETLTKGFVMGLEYGTTRKIVRSQALRDSELTALVDATRERTAAV